MIANSLLDKIRNNPNYSPQRSARWFQDQIRAVYGAGHVSTDRMLRGEAKHVSDKFGVGDLIFYVYDPKTKDKLPYWDKFPLVFPFSQTKESFTGLNLHYLPPMLRFALMNELIKINNDMGASWEVLKKSSKSQLVAPCVKQYLFNHVRSRYIRIPQDSWITAALLPSDNFQKASNSSVWAHSRRL
jgi:hypothetical protein